MRKQLKGLAPVVLLAGLGLVTSGCGLLSPTPSGGSGTPVTTVPSGDWGGGGGLFDGFGDGFLGSFGN